MRGRKLKGGRRKYGRRQESNPMDGVANLADIMLIFACGLMIAIIMFWNVDFENLNQQQESAYEDVGAVYQDPETGKIYVVQSGDSQQDGAESSSSQPEAGSGSGSQDGASQSAADSGEIES